MAIKKAGLLEQLPLRAPKLEGSLEAEEHVLGRRVLAQVAEVVEQPRARGGQVGREQLAPLRLALDCHIRVGDLLC